MKSISTALSPAQSKAMGFLNAQIVVFACVISAHALISRAVPKSVIDNCPSAQEESSASILINGEEIIRQSLTCPDGKFDNSLTSGRDYNGVGGSPRKRSSLEARDTIECEFPQLMPECQCGRAFSCNCFQGDVAPEEFDCTQLLNMVTSANEDAQTFTVAANAADVISLRTCSLIFVNNQDIAVDYCWDNLNFIGEQAWRQCVSDESDRVVGGLCNPSDGLYSIRLGPAPIPHKI